MTVAKAYTRFVGFYSDAQATASEFLRAIGFRLRVVLSNELTVDDAMVARFDNLRPDFRAA